MLYNIGMKVLRQDHNNLINQLDHVFKRDYFSLPKGDVFKGIIGQRGVGKTTFLLNYIKQNYGNSEQALYVSADNIYFSKNNLVNLVRDFVQEKDGELLCIDEIHKYDNWSQEIKNIYDLYHNKLELIFSGSSSINLTREKYDLSRRALLVEMFGFSFREWLEFVHKIKLPKLKLNDVLKAEKSKIVREIYKIPKIIGLFHEYCKSGYYPITIKHKNKNEYYDVLNAILDKTIFQDIATYHSLKTPTLNIIKKIIAYIATTPPSKVNAYNLSESVGRHHQKVAEYLNILSDASVLRYLISDGQGHKILSDAEKVYLDNTNLFYAISSEFGKQAHKGTVRELFVLNQLENAGINVMYSDKGDMIVKGNILEIGGRGKNWDQLEDVKKGYLVKDNTLYPEKGIIPIYLFGFLY